jgi:dTDP-4-dehydrorhamnose 3,5-epimerase
MAGEPRGVRIFDLRLIADERGAFFETFRRSWLPEDAPGIVQANLSRSKAGVLRGPHFHRTQSDYWCFLAGRAFVALIDLRAGSPTSGRVFTDVIDADAAPRGISIPAGVAHAFNAETDVILQYLVDAYYTGDDEFGVAWDDPDLAIPWPTTPPVLSDRDRSNPSLADVLSDPPLYAG